MKLFRDALILSAACIENITATLQDPNKLGGVSNWFLSPLSEPHLKSVNLKP